MASAFLAWARGPTGLSTVHAWGPLANWGIVLAAIADMSKPAENISFNMTGRSSCRCSHLLIAELITDLSPIASPGPWTIRPFPPQPL